MDREKHIKHFKYGVVSWDVFSDFWDKQYDFVEKINHLLQNGDSEGWEINIMFDLIGPAQKKIEECWETAKKENHDAGGNNVYSLPQIEFDELLETQRAFFKLQQTIESAENERGVSG